MQRFGARIYNVRYENGKHVQIHKIKDQIFLVLQEKLKETTAVLVSAREPISWKPASESEGRVLSCLRHWSGVKSA